MAHTYIIGQSGTGKSTLLKHRLLTDIHNGHGVLYLDPHGTDTDDLLQYIPNKRRNDVVLRDNLGGTRIASRTNVPER